MKSIKTKVKKKSPIEKAIDSVTGALKRQIEQSPVPISISICLTVGIMLSAAGLYLAWQKHVVHERRAQMEAFAEQNTRIAAANISNYIHSINQRLDFYAKSKALRKALSNNDPIGIMESNNSVKVSFPKAKHIRIFTIDEAKVDLESDPPLHFSELDIIQKAQRRETVIPEAINLGEGWQINVVTPVPFNPTQPVVGTILVTLPIDALYKSLTEGLDGLGRVSLYQTFGGKPRLMGSFGEGDVFKAERIDVPSSPWRVEFTASESLYAQTQIDFALLIMVGVICVALTLGLCGLVGSIIGKRIMKKQMSIMQTQKVMGHNSDMEFTSAGTDFLNVDISEEDESLLGDDDNLLNEQSNEPSTESSIDDDKLDESLVPLHIFRNYDVRGLADGEVTKDLALWMGKSLGSEALDKGENTLIVARDARTSSPLLMENLIRGVMDTGCNVLNIGTVPTPLMYFAVETLEESSSGVIITASHNSAEYNGFKVIMAGKPRTPKEITATRTRILQQDFRHGMGQEKQRDIVPTYIETIFSDVALASEIRVVIDAGNGVTGKVAPALFEELGCEVIPLYCDLDGTFPNHDPDPSIESNLKDLIAKVRTEEAHLGVAFDGDGDRIAVVTNQGNIIWPDQLLMLFAKDVLARNPGADVVFDVKSSRQLNNVINSHGGRPIMWKTGHAPMRAKVADSGALLGGEYSGHIFIKDRWYGFDDGMYAAARLIEIMSLRDETLDEIFEEFPKLCATPEYRFPIAEEDKYSLVQNLIAKGDFGDAKIIAVDGLRAEFTYGWGLIRASNTAAELTLRFEAETEEEVHSLKALFTREARKIDDSIEFNW